MMLDVAPMTRNVDRLTVSPRRAVTTIVPTACKETSLSNVHRLVNTHMGGCNHRHIMGFKNDRLCSSKSDTGRLEKTLPGKYMGSQAVCPALLFRNQSAQKAVLILQASLLRLVCNQPSAPLTPPPAVSASSQQIPARS